MNYNNIVNRIMFSCKDEKDVDKYMQDIEQNVFISHSGAVSYQHIIEYATLYANLCERFDVSHLSSEYMITEINDNNNVYDANIVRMNILYAREKVAKYLVHYIQNKEKQDQA